jgi:hypothetical protein
MIMGTRTAIIKPSHLINTVKHIYRKKRNKGFHLLIRLSSLITRRIKGSAAAEQFSFSYKPIVIYWYFIHT